MDQAETVYARDQCAIISHPWSERDPLTVVDRYGRILFILHHDGSTFLAEDREDEAARILIDSLRRYWWTTAETETIKTLDDCIQIAQKEADGCLHIASQKDCPAEQSHRRLIERDGIASVITKITELRDQVRGQLDRFRQTYPTRPISSQDQDGEDWGLTWLLDGLQTLSNDKTGLSYCSGDVPVQKYDEDTGVPYTREGNRATLTVYSARAKFLFALIAHSASVQKTLSKLVSTDTVITAGQTILRDKPTISGEALLRELYHRLPH